MPHLIKTSQLLFDDIITFVHSVYAQGKYMDEEEYAINFWQYAILFSGRGKNILKMIILAYSW